MEASALPASATLTRPRISIGVPLLRLRSDEQLVNLFRGGNEDAFRVIYDRYRQRLFAYARQMLGGSTDDAEDALQEIFVRAYAGLRSSHSELALRAWLYRIAHNRCVDLLRRPPRPDLEDIELVRPPSQDPAARAEQRDALKRLVIDVQRLPDQQRSALLMRELGGMPYSDLAGALEVSVPAVKSLLVRARVGLAQAEAARDTACASIRDDVLTAHDRGVRLSGMARRHMRDCPGCREFRGEVRGLSRQLAGFIPALGPLGLAAKLLGLGGSGGAAGAGAGAGGGAAAGGGALAVAGSGGTAAASAGVLATGAGHVVTLLAAAVVTAGGAVEVQNTLAPAVPHRATHHHLAPVIRPAAETQAPAGDAVAGPAEANPLPVHHAYAAPARTSTPTHHRVAARRRPASLPTVNTTPLSSDSSPSTPSDPSATDTTLAGNGTSPDSSSTTYGSGPGTTSAAGTQSGSPESSSTSSSSSGQSASGPYAYDASQTPPTTVSSGTQPTSSSGSSGPSGSGSGSSAASGSGTTPGK